jgi:Trk-type K+ transport system membrane component
MIYWPFWVPMIIIIGLIILGNITFSLIRKKFKEHKIIKDFEENLQIALDFNIDWTNKTKTQIWIEIFSTAYYVLLAAVSLTTLLATFIQLLVFLTFLLMESPRKVYNCTHKT